MVSEHILSGLLCTSVTFFTRHALVHVHASHLAPSTLIEAKLVASVRQHHLSDYLAPWPTLHLS